jgi:hypothetical protein
MKSTLTAIVATMIVLHASAQGKEFHIPPKVTRSFATQFPTGRLKKWGQKKEDYIATFRQNGKKYIARYAPDGAWQAAESPVKWTRNLPGLVRAGWNNCQYMDWLILDIKKIETPQNTLYAIHIGQIQSLGPDDADIGSEYILFFSDKGVLVRQERKS